MQCLFFTTIGSNLLSWPKSSSVRQRSSSLLIPRQPTTRRASSWENANLKDDWVRLTRFRLCNFFEPAANLSAQNPAFLLFLMLIISRADPHSTRRPLDVRWRSQHPNYIRPKTDLPGTSIGCPQWMPIWSLQRTTIGCLLGAHLKSTKDVQGSSVGRPLQISYASIMKNSFFMIFYCNKVHWDWIQVHK